MIGIFAETGFTPTELFEMTFSRLGTTLLKLLPQSVQTLTSLLNLSTTECLTSAIGGYVDNAQVNTQRISRFIRRWGGNIEGHSQIPCSIAIEQIGLPLDGIQTGLLIWPNPERYQDTALDSQKRDGQQAFEGHHALIIDDGTFWLKCGLDALVALIGFTRLANRTNSQLSRKFVGATQFAIHQLLQLKFVGGFFGKGHARYIVTCCVKGMHCIKQGVVLFFSWSKLQEHRLFHASSLASIEKFVNRKEKPNPCPKQGTPASSTAVETAWLPQAEVSVKIGSPS